MLEDYNKRIEAIKGRIECSRDIACYKTGGRPLFKDQIKKIKKGGVITREMREYDS
jgi:hypothetical protein